LEFVHAACGIYELLLARVKRVAGVAEAQEHSAAGGTGGNHVATGATKFSGFVFRMDVRFHVKGRAEYKRCAAWQALF
jgi:hypothetical protein